MARNIIGATSSPLYTVGDREDKTVKIRWKDGPRFCQICGKELTGRKQHYCSTECKAEGKRRQAEEYHRIMRERNARIKAEKETEKQEQAESVMVPRCIYCGNPLPPRRIVYCSEACRQKWEHATTRSLANEEAAKKEAKKKAKKAMTWKQILKGMAETGLQYGEYVARYEEGKK